MGDGDSSENRARRRCAADGALAQEASSRPGPALQLEGAIYTSLSFGERPKEAGLFGSMGKVGSAYDNALVGSFVATLKTELLQGHNFP